MTIRVSPLFLLLFLTTLVLDSVALAAAPDICKQLDVGRTPQVFAVQNGAVVERISLGELEFESARHLSADVEFFVSPSRLKLSPICTRNCLVVHAERSPCLGFRYYKGSLDVEPAAFAVGPYEEEVLYGLEDPRADVDAGGGVFKAAGILHGAMADLISTQREVVDFVAGKIGETEMAVKNRGDRPLSLGDFVTLEQSANWATLDANNCKNAILPPAAVCTFRLRALGAARPSGENGALFVFSFSSNGVGSKDHLVFIDREKDAVRVQSRAGYAD